MDQNRENYRSLRKEYKKQLSAAKFQSWQRFCTETESLNATARVQKLLCKSNENQVDWVYDKDGNPSVSPKETILNLLNIHFPGHQTYQQARKLNRSPQESNTNTITDTIKNIISDQKVSWAINTFQPYKTPGPDGIYPICLQSLPSRMVQIIANLFQLCLLGGYVPQIWQKTNVVFIPKPGKQNYYDSKSFRPISLTCFLLKALARCVELYLKSHILPKTPIHPNQHAYTADKSTDTALHCLVGKLENMLHHKHSALCTFLDIQGAFDHTTPTSIQKALQTHNTPQIIISFILSMLTSRYISVTLHGVTQVRSIGKGCPQGGILSPLLWNLVMDGLISILKNRNIWCLGYADDLVICVVNQDPVTTAEVTQHALNLVEDWCKDQSLSVNPKKAEAMLITRKRKIEIPQLKIFDANIQYQKSVKYLGVHIDSKLTWSTHIAQKTQKALSTLWMCKSAISHTWGLGPRQILWILHSIIHPAFLHGVLVWWTALQKTSYTSKIAKINRSALLLACGAFRTTPGQALEYLFNVTPLEIKAKQVAMNSLHRLIRSNNSVKLNTHDHTKLVHEMPEITLHPSDYTPKKIIFCNPNISFVVPSREEWQQSEVDLEVFDISVYTDGSAHELGVGTGLFIQTKNDADGLVDSEKEISIHHSPDTTIFQAELSGISVAAMILSSTTDQNIAIFTDSLSSIQTLQNPVVRTITKYECLNQLNTLAGSNQVSIIWVPGHSGIHGNERADELAGIGGLLETMGPEPSPPIAESAFKRYTKEWAASKSEEKWHYSKHGTKTKSVVRRIKGKISTHLKNIRKPLLSHTVNTITGHGPFRDHLALIKLTDEPSCPKCGANTDSNIHFIFDCIYYRKIRKKSLNVESKKQHNQNQLCITVTDLAGYIKLSDRFDTN